MPLSDDSGIFLRNASGALLFLRDQARQDGNAGADEEADDAEEHIRRDLLAQKRNAKSGAIIGLRKKMRDASCALVFSSAIMWQT